LKDINT